MRYDTPTAAVLHQQIPSDCAVAIDPAQVLRTEEMPVGAGWRKVLLSAGSLAQKVLNADPRRKRATLWGVAVDPTGFDGIMVGTMGDVQQNTGAILVAIPGLNTAALRYDTRTRGELWAKPIVIGDDGAGAFTGFGPSTTDAFLNLSVEQWSA